MRKVLPLIFIGVLVAANAVAQSGRRIKNPPPPPPPPPAPAEESLTAAPEGTLSPIVGGTLPDGLLKHELTSIDNSRFRLADFSGKVIVVNIWATWCGPCRREIPDYEKVRKEYAGRAVEFIALTTEDPVTAASRVQKFARDFHFGFLVGWADRETARTLMNGKNAIPQTLVIGTDGRLINRWTGYSASQSGDHLRATIERALSDSASSAQNAGRQGP